MNKINHFDLHNGMWLSRISFMKVIGNNFGGIRVSNEDGFEWSIATDIVIEECYTTTFKETKEVTKTALAEILSTARDAIVMVSFTKQPTSADIKNNIQELMAQEKITNKAITEVLKGEERILTGYVIGSEPLLGRSIVIDLELKKEVVESKEGEPYDKRMRQVDHRTLNWIIYKNVKYVLK